MPVSALVYQQILGSQPGGLLAERVSFQVLIADRLLGQHRHLARFQIGDALGSTFTLEQRQSSQQVAAHYTLLVVMGHHQATGMTQPQSAKNRIFFLVGCESRSNGLGTLQFLSGFSERLLEAVTLFQPLFYEMGYYFRVGFRLKVMPTCF